MERLIKDANKLRVAQGKTGDLTIEKYSDVIEAIHEVQTNMGITGTTAKEAMTTISGSINATKAAWKNLLVSFGKGSRADIKRSMDGMISSAKNAAQNLIPVIGNALSGIGTLFAELGPVIAQELPGLITEVAPAFLNAIGSLISSIVTNAPAIFSSLWSVFNSTIDEIRGWLEEKFPGLGTVFENLGTIISNVSSAVSTGWETIKSTVSSIAESIDFTGILSDVTGILAGNKAVIEEYAGVLGPLKVVIGGVAGAFIMLKAATAISSTIEAAKNAFAAFNAVLAANPIGAVAAAIGFLVGAFVTAYSNIEWFRNAVDTAWASIKNAAATAWEGIQTVWNGAGEFFNGIFSAISENPALSAITDIITAPFKAAFAVIDLIWSGFSAIFTGAWDTVGAAASNMVQTISAPFVNAWTLIQSAWNGAASWFDGIISGVQTTFDNIATAVNSALTAVSDFFGFSPSDIFSGVADSIAGAFAKIAGAVQGAIDKIREFFGLTGKNSAVVGEYGPQMIPGGQGLGVLPQYNARAMNTGHIFNRPTLFGFADGRFQVAGDAGPEAVVGVSSLRDMIRDAVGDQLGAILNGMSDIRAGQGRDMQLVLDSGELVGGIANQMNRRLGSISRWREGGHA